MIVFFGHPAYRVIDGGEFGASIKDVSLHSGNTVRQMDALQRAAGREGSIIDPFQSLRKNDAGQPGAAGESITIDRSQCFASSNGKQTGTPIESTGADPLHAVWEHDASQGSMILKGVVCDPLHNVTIAVLTGKDQCGVRTGVAADGAVCAVQHRKGKITDRTGCSIPLKLHSILQTPLSGIASGLTGRHYPLTAFKGIIRNIRNAFRQADRL